MQSLHRPGGLLASFLGVPVRSLQGSHTVSLGMGCSGQGESPALCKPGLCQKVVKGPRGESVWCGLALTRQSPEGVGTCTEMQKCNGGVTLLTWGRV